MSFVMLSWCSHELYLYELWFHWPRPANRRGLGLGVKIQCNCLWIVALVFCLACCSVACFLQQCCIITVCSVQLTCCLTKTVGVSWLTRNLCLVVCVCVSFTNVCCCLKNKQLSRDCELFSVSMYEWVSVSEFVFAGHVSFFSERRNVRGCQGWPLWLHLD